jgi:hypothetical protein
MNKLAKLLLLTCVVGVVGAWVIRTLSRRVKMKQLQKLLGEEWVEREMLCADPQHLLGRWYRKSVDNPLTRYVDELAGFVLNSGAVTCDTARLATKLKGEFGETLIEMDYAVFLAKQGFKVTMEPSAPKAGPDLLGVRGHEFYFEMRKVGLDEVRAAADLASEDVFTRLCGTPSRYGILISMTDEYSAFSPQLKRALRVVVTVLKDLGEKHVQKASLFYHGPTDYALREGDEGEPDFDYSDGEKLAAQIREFEREKRARFVARFDDTGKENPRTSVGVHPLGSDPHLLKPDQTYLRLRRILHKKCDQLPKGSRGIIVLELSDLEKLVVGQYTLESSLYGELQMTLRAAPPGKDFQVDENRKRNGFFLTTSRVSAVVVERVKIGDDFSFSREVFPTNNPQAAVLTLGELKSFGTIAEGLENLCAEQLRK